MPEDSYEMLERNLPVYVIDIGYDEKYYARHPNPWFYVMYKHVSSRNTFVS